MTKPRKPITRHYWTPAEDAQLRALYPDHRTADIAAALGRQVGQVYDRANRIGLAKSAAFLSSEASGRIARGVQQSPAMLTARYRVGQEPWNKGMKGLQLGNGLTRFKAGQMNGKAMQHWVPVGSYRINSEGTLDRKVTDLGRGPADWEAVHRLVWKAAHGALPAGHVVAFKPGRRTTVLERITLDALECISRAELLRRNSPHRSHPELAKLVHLKGAITKQVNRIIREKEQQP